MDFLKIYDGMDTIKRLHEEKEFFGMKPSDLHGYYLQEDVHDVHVYRILKGSYEEGYENDENAIAVEHEKLCKFELLEFLDKNPKNRQQRDEMFQAYSDDFLLSTAIKFDDNKGMENWEMETVFSLEEAMELVTGNGNYKI